MPIVPVRDPAPQQCIEFSLICLSAVSADGKKMAFQVTHTTDRAGVGYGIVLYRF